MAVDPQTLLNEVAAYRSYDARSLELYKIALLKQLLLAANPNAVTDPAVLLAEMNCYACLAPIQLQLIELALLESLVETGINPAGGVYVFDETSGVVVGGVPTVIPAVSIAFCVLNDGTMFTWYNGAWH